ncbi:hypothetical protein P7C70_g4363, partial [Phenoliferia sp. Uapishka_3]
MSFSFPFSRRKITQVTPSPSMPSHSDDSTFADEGLPDCPTGPEPPSIRSAAGGGPLNYEKDGVEETKEIGDEEGAVVPASEVPEGGARAYLTVVGGSIALFTTFGLNNSFGVFQAEFEKTESTIKLSTFYDLLDWVCEFGLDVPWWTSIWKTLAIINSTAVISRGGVGFLADKFGIINVALPVTALTGILSFAMLGATNTPGSLIWMLLFGLAKHVLILPHANLSFIADLAYQTCSGGFVTLLSPLMMSLAVDVSEIGVRVGFGFAFVALATLIGTPIAGALLTASGTYAAPCGFAGGMILVGTASLSMARQRVVRKKGVWKV